MLQQFRQRLFVGGRPLGRGHVPPSEVPLRQIFPTATHPVEESIVSAYYFVQVRADNADDIAFRETAESGFHIEQRVLSPLTLGNVHRLADIVEGIALIIVHQRYAEQRPPYLSIFADIPLLHTVGAQLTGS